MRSFAAILLRRLAFRPITGRPGLAVTTVIYDYLSESTRKDVETMLLDCVSNETDESVRSKILDTVTEFAEGSIHRGRACHPIPALERSKSESARFQFRSMAGAPSIRRPIYRLG